MAIEFGFLNYLQSVGPLVAKVANRIHCGEIPENEQLPAISILKSGADNPVVMDGETNMAMASLTVDCTTGTKVDASQLAEIVRNGNAATNGGTPLNGFSGAMGAYNVQGCFLEDEADLDPLLFPEVAPLKRYVTRLRFSLWFDQTATSG
jgi:hypothetical protein